MAPIEIGTILRRWIEVLTATYLAWREAVRARQVLMVACENGRFIVRRPRQERDKGGWQEQANQPEENLAVLASGAPIPAEVTRAAASGLIVFQLPADLLVVRRVAVPLQAREFLPGIVRNQIDRLSPWPADLVVYGFAAEADAEDAAALDVCVLIALRSDIDRARNELAALGLAVDRIVARQPSPPASPTPAPQASRPPPRPDGAGKALAAREGRIAAKTVTLWSRVADVSPEYLAGAVRRVGAGIAAAAAASLVLSLWTIGSAASLGGESEEIEARVKTLQRQIQGPASLASLSAGERAWYAKETAPTAAIVLEALSRALPDGAHLTELRLENTTLRMIGLAHDAPSLIAPLEHSGHLTDVRFFAPTIREADGALFRFNIEARVEPHFKIAEEGP